MVDTAIRNDSVTVGTTAVELSPRQSNGRRFFYVKNTSSGAASTAKITVTFSDLQNAVAGYGFVLDPGQSVTDSQLAEYPCWAGRIAAISDTVGGTVAIVERLI